MSSWRVTATATAPGDFPELVPVTTTVVARDIVSAIERAHAELEVSYAEPIVITAAEEV